MCFSVRTPGNAARPTSDSFPHYQRCPNSGESGWCIFSDWGRRKSGRKTNKKKGASKTGAAKASNPSFPLSLALLFLLLLCCSLFRFPVGLSAFIPLSFTLRLNVGLGMVVFSFVFQGYVKWKKVYEVEYTYILTFLLRPWTRFSVGFFPNEERKGDGFVVHSSPWDRE